MAILSIFSRLFGGSAASPITGPELLSDDPLPSSEDEEIQHWLDLQLNGYIDEAPATGNSLYSNIEPINRWRHGNRVLKAPQRLDDTPTKSHYDVSFRRVGKTLAKGRRRCSRCGHALMGHGAPTAGMDEVEKVRAAKAKAKAGRSSKGVRKAKSASKRKAKGSKAEGRRLGSRAG